MIAKFVSQKQENVFASVLKTFISACQTAILLPNHVSLDKTRENEGTEEEAPSPDLRIC